MAEGFVFFPSFHEAIKDLPDTERLGVYDALVRYGLYGEIMEMPPLVKSLFVLMRPNIDASQRRYRANRENGSKGGRPPKKTTENPNQTQAKPNGYQEKETDIEKESDIEKDSDSDSEPEMERESPGGGGSFPAPFRPCSETEFEERRKAALSMLGADW